MAAPCDLHVPCRQSNIFPEDLALEAAKWYKTLAIDQVVDNSDDSKSKSKVHVSINKINPSESFRAKLNQLERGTNVKILSRLTIQCSGKTNISRAIKSELEKFDLVAGRPLDAGALERLVEEDVDIISLDVEKIKGYHFKRELVKMVIKRGITFELCYGPCVADVTARQQTIDLAQDLFIFSKGKNVILSGGCSNVQFMRGPYDVANLAVLFGLSTGDAKLTVTTNSLNAIKHSEVRKSISGAMEICMITNIDKVSKVTDESRKRPLSKKQRQKAKKMKLAY